MTQPNCIVSEEKVTFRLKLTKWHFNKHFNFQNYITEVDFLHAWKCLLAGHEFRVNFIDILLKFLTPLEKTFTSV